MAQPLRITWQKLVSLLYWRAIKMNHLDSIAARQRKSLVRDAIFAAFVALGAIVSLGTVSTVAHAASTHIASR